MSCTGVRVFLDKLMKACKSRAPRQLLSRAALPQGRRTTEESRPEAQRQRGHDGPKQ